MFVVDFLIYVVLATQGDIYTTPCFIVSFHDHGPRTEGIHIYRRFDSDKIVCHHKCENDEACLGYTYNYGSEKCTLSNDTLMELSTCVLCRFYEKTSQSSSTAMTTLIIPNRTAINNNTILTQVNTSALLTPTVFVPPSSSSPNSTSETPQSSTTKVLTFSLYLLSSTNLSLESTFPVSQSLSDTISTSSNLQPTTLPSLPTFSPILQLLSSPSLPSSLSLPSSTSSSFSSSSSSSSSAPPSFTSPLSSSFSFSPSSSLSSSSPPPPPPLSSSSASSLTSSSSSPLPSPSSSLTSSLSSFSWSSQPLTSSSFSSFYSFSPSSSGVSSSSLSTFYQLSTSPGMETETMTVQITKGTVECVCICRPQNNTIQETMDLRKKELSVEKEMLSSVLRKQISASDSRQSSTVIGFIGVGMISLVVGIIIFPDAISLIYFIYEVLKK